VAVGAKHTTKSISEIAAASITGPSVRRPPHGARPTSRGAADALKAQELAILELFKELS
jgi:hypothetical protein